MTEVSGFLQGNFPEYCLESSYFYNLGHLKDQGLINVDVPSILAIAGLKLVRPLQYQEQNITGFSRPLGKELNAGKP